MGMTCLLYTSDAADDLLCVDLGGRSIIKKKKKRQTKDKQYILDCTHNQARYSSTSQEQQHETPNDTAR